MKILYVGTERRSAEAVAAALRGITQNVAPTWTNSLAHAPTWLEGNREAAALIVDAEIHAGEWPASLRQLRSLPLRPAVVVLVAEGTQPRFESLGPPADGYVTRGDTFVRDLPVAVIAAVTRVRGSQPPPPATSTVAEPPPRVESPRERVQGPARWKKALEKVRRTERVTTPKPADPPADTLTAQLTDALTAKSALERRLAELEAASLEREQVWSTERAAAAERQDYLDALVQLERMARTDIEQELETAAAALKEAEQRRLAELAATRDAHERAAAEQLTELQRELQAEIAQEVEKRRTAEAILATTTHDEGEPQASVACDGAQATELAARQAHFDRELSQSEADRQRLEERLQETVAALDEARHQYQVATADIERSSQQAANLAAQLADAQAASEALRRRLATADDAIEQASQRQAELVGEIHQERETRQQHDAALATAAGDIAEIRARFEREMSQAEQDRDSLRQQLSDAEAALDRSRHAHASAIAESEASAARAAGLSEQLADIMSNRDHLERELTAARAEFKKADDRAAHERQTAASRAAELEARLDGQIRHERAARAALEQALADAEAALRVAQQQHAAALAESASELSELQASVEGQLSQAAADRESLQRRLRETEIALDQARRDHQSATADVDRLIRREGDLSTQLADASAARDSAEETLAEATRELANARELGARARAATERRRADLEALVVSEIHMRKALEQALTNTRAAAIDAEGRLRAEADLLRAQAVEREATFEAQFASERRDHESRVSEMQQECDRLGQVGAAADAEIQRVRVELSEAQHVLEDTRRAFQDTLNRLSSEHATTMAALTASVAERDEWLKEQAARHETSLQASERAHMEMRERLDAALAARRDEIEQVQEKLMAMVEALESTKHRPDVLDIDRQADLAMVRRTQGGALASTG